MIFSHQFNTNFGSFIVIMTCISDFTILYTWFQMYQSIATIIILCSFLGLSACSTAPKPVPSQSEIPATEIEPPKISEKESQKHQIATLERKALLAKKTQVWAEFIQFSQQLWHLSDEDNQAAIEFQIWHSLKHLPASTLIELAEQSPTLANWTTFAEITQQHPIWQKQRLKDWQDFSLDDPTALYNYHLLPALLTQLNHRNPVTRIAILLPFTGQYAGISHQIRNGILKNHFQQLKHQKSALEFDFYDSSDLTQIQSLYQTAMAQGAEWAIGPLRKTAIEQLTPLAPKNVLALNQVDLPSIWQFNFKSESEAHQINQQLCHQNFQRIGILSSTMDADTRLAQDILFGWHQQSQNRNQTAILKTYPARNPNLRQALGSLINEKQSQERNNNLRWLFGQNLQFTPRLRQDLDAIVLVGNERRLAVFKPQFEFFDLNLPTYGTSKITPSQLFQTPLNPDLAGLIFPTLPAAILPVSVETAFEAYGWDSLTLVQNLNRLDSGLCLNNGVTGRLKIQDREVDHLFIWARYNARGQAVPLHLPNPSGTP